MEAGESGLLTEGSEVLHPFENHIIRDSTGGSGLDLSQHSGKRNEGVVL